MSMEALLFGGLVSGVFASGAGFACAIVFLRADLRRGAGLSARQQTQILAELAAHRRHVEELAQELRTWIVASESSPAPRTEAPRSDPDGWSTARAVEAVRAGMTPQEASQLLGVPKRELRLVADVARLAVCGPVQG